MRTSETLDKLNKIASGSPVFQSATFFFFTYSVTSNLLGIV